MGAHGKSDRLHTLPAYDFLLPLNTFKTSKSHNKRDESQKHNICDFITSVLPMRQAWGESKWLFTLPAYGFLLPPNTFKTSTSTYERNISQNLKSVML